jgi:tetratricopeptide (TPR) repeat protein
MRENYGTVYTIFCIALVVIAIGVAVIARWSSSRPKLRREDEDAILLGIGALYFWAGVELLLYSAYFWVFWDWLSAKDVPKMALSVVLITCAFVTPRLLQRRSTLVFFAFAAHAFILLFIFLNTGTLDYPHFLNLPYSVFAFFVLACFGLTGFFNPQSDEKPKRDAEAQSFPVEPMLKRWSNILLGLASLYLIIYIADFSRHYPRIGSAAYVYLLISVPLAYFSAFLFRKAFVLALLPTVASVFLYGYFFVRMPVTYPFYLNMLFNLIVITAMLYFLAKISKPKAINLPEKPKRQAPVPSPQLSKPVPIGSMLKPQAASPNPKPQTTSPTPAQFMRDNLFGDLPLETWAAVDTDIEPWAFFTKAKKAIAENNLALARMVLETVLKQEKLETRQYLQAWYFLRTIGVQPPAEQAKQVYGMVFELGLSKGLDVLAVYRDDSARYYPAGGGGFILEPEPDRSYAPIDKLLALAATFVAKLSPLEGEHPQAPKLGEACVYILTPSGLLPAYIGSANMFTIKMNRIASPLFDAATHVLTMLNDIAKEMAKKGEGMSLHPPKEGQENQIEMVYTRLQNGYPIHTGDQSSPVNAMSLNLEHPKTLDEWHNRGIYYTMLRNYQGALADFNHAIELAPDCLYAYVSRGNTYSYLENYEAAMQDYQHVIAKAPSIPNTYINRGLAYIRQGKKELGLDDLDYAVSLTWEAYIIRASVMTQLGEYEIALADYNDLIQKKPELAIAYAGRANVYNKMGNYQAAMADAMRAKNFSQRNNP